MSTVTVPRQVTSQEVVEALRDGLDPRYQVQPGTRMPRAPFAQPQPAPAELIMVSSSPMVRAQVKIAPRDGATDLQITPGGLLGDLLMNKLGIAQTIHRTLRNAPSLR
jgi:hypothetical protein